jgi:hypothetical protein
MNGLADIGIRSEAAMSGTADIGRGRPMWVLIGLVRIMTADISVKAIGMDPVAMLSITIDGIAIATATSIAE